MDPLPELIKGLEIIEPFLKQFGFEFVDHESGKGSGGQVTVATYINGLKKFIIGYRYTIGQVEYQYDNSIVNHDFYLDQLGYFDKKCYPGFQSEDKLLAFKNILHDFEYLVEDYFIGHCVELKRIAVLHEQLMAKDNKIYEKEYNDHFDENRIEKARKEFKNRYFKKCLEIYETVENKTLLNDLDRKSIEYCEHHI